MRQDKINYLEYQLDIRHHRKTVTIAQGECFVFVQYRVQTLYPNCIHWAIQAYLYKVKSIPNGSGNICYRRRCMDYVRRENRISKNLHF